MKKTILLIIASLFITIKILPQADASNRIKYANGKNNTVSFGINIPVGEFSKTHVAGTGLTYSWSHYRFGSLKVLPKKVIGFTAEGGAGYYLGKKETVAGYNYRYKGYVVIHAYGGMIYNPSKKANILLVAGPAIGIDNSHTDAGLGANLYTSYYLSERIALMPGMAFLKYQDAAALWYCFIRAAYSF